MCDSCADPKVARMRHTGVSRTVNITSWIGNGKPRLGVPVLMRRPQSTVTGIWERRTNAVEIVRSTVDLYSFSHVGLDVQGEVTTSIFNIQGPSSFQKHEHHVE